MDVSPHQLDAFLLNRADPELLQSALWQEFQERLGHRTRVFTLRHEGEIVASMLCYDRALSWGLHYWQCPHGPILQHALPLDQRASVVEQLISQVNAAMKEDRALFLRWDPSRVEVERFSEYLRLQTVPATQPQIRWVLDVTPTEEALLSGMKPKTRYNIRLAEKRIVTVRWSRQVEDAEQFYQLVKALEGHKHLQFYPKHYYQRLADVGGDHVQFGFARYQDRVIAGQMMIFFGNTATYLHGASTNIARDVMAPYVLHWEAIKLARERGCTQYDFGAIAPPGETQHKYAGITRFKQGFGGMPIVYPDSMDLIYRPVWYRIYRLFRSAG
ncbi:MAG: peptidoglycan bridge formation glycyltransferase FemA/FemB family protein [Patescibacteria group bacterium]